MNNKGISELETSLFLFFLCLSIISFIKIDHHFKEVQKQDLYEFERNWNKFTPRNVQRIYKEESR